MRFLAIATILLAGFFCQCLGICPSTSSTGNVPPGGANGSPTPVPEASVAGMPIPGASVAISPIPIAPSPSGSGNNSCLPGIVAITVGGTCASPGPSSSPVSTASLAGTYTPSGSLTKTDYFLTIGSGSPPVVSMKYTVIGPGAASFQVVGFTGTLTGTTLVLTSSSPSVTPACGAPYVLTYMLTSEQPPTFQLSNASTCPNGANSAASQGPKTFIRGGPAP